MNDLEIDSGNFRVGAVTFSDNARQEFYLNSYNKMQDIERALSRIRYVYGSTNTADALRMVRETMLTTSNGDRPGKIYRKIDTATLKNILFFDQTILWVGTCKLGFFFQQRELKWWMFMSD